ncbi:hypothetical protein F4802DRAFT_373509 [Xylaria palmicola]|nr:hypothetical protein F4802DRAFT_373509 [Xylaria palmicola]
MKSLAAAAPLLVFWALGILTLVGASTVLTFSDQDCRTFSESINAKDSTGSGACKELAPSYGSFMIGQLGEDCTVTIYGDDPDDPFCSASHQKLAQIGSCYNSTWTYFSVDNCAAVDTTTSSSKTTSVTSTTSTTSTSTPTTTPTTTSEPAPTAVNVGAIVGGTISGVFVVAVLGGAALYFFWFRPRQQRRLAQLTPRSDSTSRINTPYVADGVNKRQDSHTKSDLQINTSSYSPVSRESEVYELSPQYIAEVHEQTHVRHELPP